MTRGACRAPAASTRPERIRRATRAAGPRTSSDARAADRSGRARTSRRSSRACSRSGKTASTSPITRLAGRSMRPRRRARRARGVVCADGRRLGRVVRRDARVSRTARASARRSAGRLRRAEDQRRAGPARDPQYIRRGSARRRHARRVRFARLILREYARRNRIDLALVEPRDDGAFATDDIVAAIGTRADLVVVSQVMFNTGQRLTDLPSIVARDSRSRRAA